MINTVLQNVLFAARDVECDLERAYPRWTACLLPNAIGVIGRLSDQQWKLCDDS